MASKPKKTLGDVGQRIELLVRGPIPRVAPYAKGFRGRLYVPPDVKAWRKRIAKAFIRGGGKAPPGDATYDVQYVYHMVGNHADLDSITHSAQDALSKDALCVVDKEWYGTYSRCCESPSKAKEHISIRASIVPRGDVDAARTVADGPGTPGGSDPVGSSVPSKG